MTFVDKVRGNILKNGLLEEGERVLVGLSGGADSVALLLSLCAIGRYEVLAAHVNHGIRGEEAEKDEEFCRALCERLKVEFFSVRLDVPTEAEKNKVSLETAARDGRYAFLSQTAARETCTVATAHNSNDNLETVLFNLSRGTALKGLCGIPVSRRDGAGVKIIRPLLSVSREEIEEYLAENGQPYRIDSTNLEDGATRNRLRHFVLPELLKVFPEGLSAVSRMTSLLSADAECLDRAAAKLVKEYNVWGVDIFINEDIALVSRAVKTICEGLCGHSLGEVHVRALCDMIKSRRGECALPGGRVVLKNRRFHLLWHTPEVPEEPEVECKMGEYSLWNGYFAEVTQEYTQIYIGVNKTITYQVPNCDILQGEKAVFRTRRAGDTVYLPRRRVTKSLKKLLNEEKIPLNLRDRLPVLAVGGRVYLLPVEEFRQ